MRILLLLVSPSIVSANPVFAQLAHYNAEAVTSNLSAEGGKVNVFKTNQILGRHSLQLSFNDRKGRARSATPDPWVHKAHRRREVTGHEEIGRSMSFVTRWTM